MNNTDALAAVALWYNDLRETSNDAFMPLYADEHRYLVLKGGGGSGKSIFAGRKLLERCLCEPGHRFLCCRKVARTLRESCFRQLLGQLAEHYPDVRRKVNRSDLSIRFANGSEILFAGLDDVEKLKSIYGLTGIWIEEASELLESDFNQLDIRLRGETRYYKQIILTFNPVSITHWLKARFFDRSDARAKTHESTYNQNRFLDAEAVRTLESFKDTDEYYYQVYCLGMWGVLGKSVFDAKAVTGRLGQGVRPVRTGLFLYDDDGLALSEIRFADGADGCIRVYREPEAGVPYVIGGDTAGEGSDSFAAQVIDNRTGEQVCVLHGQFDEDVFARQVYCLGMWYNTALVGLETNFSTYPVRELERLSYPKQYVRESVDDFTHRVKRSFGFQTTQKTRPVMIAGLIKEVREDISIVSDKETLLEMLTFVRAEGTLRPEAEPGAHDDCVMALAIAHQIRHQQDVLPAQGAGGETAWTPDMWEDFENAGPEGRRYLMEKWGRPKRSGT